MYPKLSRGYFNLLNLVLAILLIATFSDVGRVLRQYIDSHLSRVSVALVQGPGR